jgi:hypothetical protein
MPPRKKCVFKTSKIAFQAHFDHKLVLTDLWLTNTYPLISKRIKSNWRIIQEYINLLNFLDILGGNWSLLCVCHQEYMYMCICKKGKEYRTRYNMLRIRRFVKLRSRNSKIDQWESSTQTANCGCGLSAN